MDQKVNLQSTAFDEKFCGSCGQKIKKLAEICPKCGVRQKTLINKALLLIITLIFGGLGGHKFYIGKNWQGAFYLILCWTGIPSIIALIEFIIYAFTSTERLQEKYSGSSIGIVIAIVACSFFFLAIIGILAAIAIPNFVQYRNRAFQAAVVYELQSLIAAENEYFAVHSKYSNNLSELNINPSDSKIRIEIISADTTCFEAIGKHTQFEKTMSVDCNGLK